jgi:hypothetical protein
VLEARYGVEAGRVVVGGGRDSPWWREIVRIRDGVREAAERGWFEAGGHWDGDVILVGPVVGGSPVG